MLLRIVIFVTILMVVLLGLRRIWRDWTSMLRSDAETERHLRRQRDLRERDQPGVIDLKRDEDGTFRPDDDDKQS